MKFEWNDAKNRTNILKHGISFEEASEIFNDPMIISKLDVRYDYGEERWFSVGSTKKGMVTMVAHLYFDEKQEPIIRIISARKATQSEVKAYA
ncbi:MAG: BrnT family toxin [Sulfuricurvum sp.]